ncbi:MAG TPA: RagB/SusD family nutrient uptake outer membrane protein, partial [Flavitalea sp.]|nr:RagB/SusD family nutrient uptake outer membrane protein [Flavitalea sp.]
MKHRIIASLCLVIIVAFSSCKKGFLDKTPDGDLTMKDVFTNPVYSEQYLTNIYTHLPYEFQIVDNAPAGKMYNLFVGSTDELEMSYDPNFANNMNIGNWNPASDFNDIWGQCYIAIRKANLFLENIDQLVPSDLATTARIDRWKGEAIFLRAYYHFLIMRAYGPIPIIDSTVNLNEGLKAFTRQPIEECVNFVTSQCDEAMAKLEPKVTTTTDYGRPSKATCLALKARVLLYLASPLWNGG